MKNCFFNLVAASTFSLVLTSTALASTIVSVDFEASQKLGKIIAIEGVKQEAGNFVWATGFSDEFLFLFSCKTMKENDSALENWNCEAHCIGNGFQLEGECADLRDSELKRILN